MGNDLRLALRRLLAHPRYAIVVSATIGVAIAAATSVFSIVDQTILRPAPYAEADRLVDVLDTSRTEGGGGSSLTPMKIAGWQAQRSLFERFEAFEPIQFDISGDGPPERVRAERVSLGLLGMLGMAPELGRDFVAGEGRPGSERVAIISDALWRRRFGADAGAPGRRLILNDEPYTVVGVMPRQFRLLSADTEVWVPVDITAYVGRAETFGFYGIGRLARGVAMPTAQAMADQIADRLQQSSPIPRSWDLSLDRKRVASVDPTTRTAMFVLLAAVGFVLVIACANVTSLVLTEIGSRARDMIVRSALGASRWRLVRSILVETSMLALAGGVAGVVLAEWAVVALVAAMPDGLIWMSTSPIDVDGRVLIVAASLTIVTAFVVGIIPGLRASRGGNADAALRRGGRVAVGRLPSGLVIAQVAFALVLLAGATIMARTLVNLHAIDPGFEPRGLVAMHVDLASDRYPTAAARAAVVDEILRRVGSVPGVSAAAVAQGVPPRLGGFRSGSLQEDGRGTVDPQVLVMRNTVTPGYFAATRTPLLAGRGIAAHDEDTSVVVSEALAERLAPGTGAIGKRFRIGTQGNWQTIVGIAGNVEARIGRDERVGLQIYAPWPVPRTPAGTSSQPLSRTRSYAWRILVVRASDPAAVVALVKQAIWTVDPLQPVERVALVSDMYADTFGRQRFVLLLMTALSLVALALTAAGVFGLLSQAVVQRRREIGIRIALGAAPGQVVRMIAGHGLALTIAGCAIGLAGTAAVAPAMRSLVYGVSPTDPVSYAAVAVLLSLVALLACWLPARAAAGVDPATALRAE